MNGYKSLKPGFRPGIFDSLFTNRVNDEIALLREINIPLLILFGYNDAMINQHYLDNVELPLFNKRIYKLYGASYFVNIDMPSEVNTLILQYVKDVFSNDDV